MVSIIILHSHTYLRRMSELVEIARPHILMPPAGDGCQSAGCHSDGHHSNRHSCGCVLGMCPSPQTTAASNHCKM